MFLHSRLAGTGQGQDHWGSGRHAGGARSLSRGSMAAMPLTVIRKSVGVVN